MTTTAKRFSLAEYHRLCEIGFFQEDDRIELIRGEIIEMAAKGTAQVTCCMHLNRELVFFVAETDTIVRCQDPITLPNHSEPEPDFVIVREQGDRYLKHHPYPADILLVIEIADSSLKYDREVKLPLYAEAGITDYWLFNLTDSYLEAYGQPYQTSQNQYGYGIKQIFFPNQSIVLPGLKNCHLDLAKVFPLP